VSDIAPAPQFPERAPQIYERKIAPSVAGNQGPLRFQEGIGTDTDVPNEFANGASQGYQSSPGRPNRNANVFEKWPEETIQERAHLGSAAWVEAPTLLGEFSGGAFVDYADLHFDEVIQDGTRQQRANPAVVND
jgi:hypothetical protein